MAAAGGKTRRASRGGWRRTYVQAHLVVQRALVGRLQVCKGLVVLDHLLLRQSGGVTRVAYRGVRGWRGHGSLSAVPEARLYLKPLHRVLHVVLLHRVALRGGGEQSTAEVCEGDHAARRGHEREGWRTAGVAPAVVSAAAASAWKPRQSSAVVCFTVPPTCPLARVPFTRTPLCSPLSRSLPRAVVPLPWAVPAAGTSASACCTCWRRRKILSSASFSASRSFRIISPSSASSLRTCERCASSCEKEGGRVGEREGCEG